MTPATSTTSIPTMTSEPPVVLGLCSGTHDSAAALITGGNLVGLVEEERLNGVKHTDLYPEQAISWLLETAGLSPGQVTHVAYNFDPRRYLAAAVAVLPYLARPVTARRALPRARSFAQVYRNARDRLRRFQTRFPAATVTGVEHHLAHGMYALAAGLDDLDPDPGEVAVLVVDSLGETATTTISCARRAGTGVEFRRMLTLSDPASLGYVYGAVTRHLGWRRGDEEGTVMALAALGDPDRFRELFRQAIPITETGFGLDLRLFPLRVLARRTRALTGASTLLVGGGVAMNCVAIGQICQQAGFNRIAVPPAPGDAGTSAGAALSLHHELTGCLAGAAGVCYLGPGYPDVRLTPRPRPGLTAVQLTSPARLIAQRLADGQIIGLFQGRLEAGPRALGNRSILASPLQAGVVDRLNATVKYREPFRPFAPVVLADHAEVYFTLGQPSPFMSIASGVTALAHRVIPAVVHVNGTARVQTVTPEQNPLLAEILTAFAAITGHPVLINTSLNIKGKPICGTPDAALDCLAESGLDALLLENWWVTKTSTLASADTDPTSARPAAVTS